MANSKRTDEETEMFPTRNNMADETRQSVVEILTAQLADMLDLHSHIKHAHWNVKGVHFRSLHLLFDEAAENLEEYIDTVAERITALGGYAPGTLRMGAAASRLPEYPADAIEGMDHVEALSERYGILGKSTRDGIDSTDELGDAGTSDMLTDVSRDLDKYLWFIESFANGNGK